MRRRRSVMWLDNQQVQSIFQVNCLQLNVTSDCVFASGGIPLWIALRWYRLCCSLTFGPASLRACLSALMFHQLVCDALIS